jgi:hypothetical protein
MCFAFNIHHESVLCFNGTNTRLFRVIKSASQNCCSPRHQQFLGTLQTIQHGKTEQPAITTTTTTKKQQQNKQQQKQTKTTTTKKNN